MVWKRETSYDLLLKVIRICDLGILVKHRGVVLYKSVLSPAEQHCLILVLAQSRQTHNYA
jgi:hypothetical protein